MRLAVLCVVATIATQFPGVHSFQASFGVKFCPPTHSHRTQSQAALGWNRRRAVRCAAAQELFVYNIPNPISYTDALELQKRLQSERIRQKNAPHPVEVSRFPAHTQIRPTDARPWSR